MRPILLITSAALLLAVGVASAPVLAAGEAQLDFRELVRLGNASPRLYSILANWHGQPVLEQYFHGKKATTYANVKSASKSVLAALIGIAIERKLIPGVRTPITFSGAQLNTGRPAPRLGEHTAEVRAEYGF